ncbi:MAG: hypothetical protein M9936_22565 [Caldilinea sp.]|nr:hypothetical protein [Caldilineaceae bacterium]MCB9121210.1 hypothetical protein [Caldilineaceae bacterium]MCO5212491.1 hypothetical protein [Caldilinea sp.]MCW5840813.1 hypothetical protein [Caldilinea sp.]
MATARRPLFSTAASPANTPPAPVEHQVFMVRAWRTQPDGPWEYVLHRSGSDEVEHFISSADLFDAFERKLSDGHKGPFRPAPPQA